MRIFTLIFCKIISKKSTNFLETIGASSNFPEAMDWPSNSPDLNPIKNLWAIVKRNVEMQMPKNLSELEQHMVEEWDRIPNSVLINCIGSMRRRCEMVIENNGERINY